MIDVKEKEGMGVKDIPNTYFDETYSYSDFNLEGINKMIEKYIKYRTKLVKEGKFIEDDITLTDVNGSLEIKIIFVVKN